VPLARDPWTRAPIKALNFTHAAFEMRLICQTTAHELLCTWFQMQIAWNYKKQGERIPWPICRPADQQSLSCWQQETSLPHLRKVVLHHFCPPLYTPTLLSGTINNLT
jgi:hypothetical protein